MLRLLLLVALGVAGFFVARRFISRNGDVEEPDDLFESADIHSTAG